MKQIHLTRMKGGLRVLRDVKQTERPFSLGLWFGEISEIEWEHGPDLDSGNPQHECGSVGCAIGWMTQDPWHQKQGLRIGILEDDQGIDDKTPVPFYRDRYTGKITTGWMAAAEYFGISEQETSHLFGYERDTVTDRLIYKTIDHVIERFDQFRHKCQEKYNLELAELDDNFPF
ncbi:MAG: hypothetical protein PHT60_13880 [Acidiphilium sp.]|nr:hypothetical protein [Acidiphilium sp.]MDD4936854.1 hypothetical protein [Acidiphilium sp.]